MAKRIFLQIESCPYGNILINLNYIDIPVLYLFLKNPQFFLIPHTLDKFHIGDS